MIKAVKFILVNIINFIMLGVISFAALNIFKYNIIMFIVAICVYCIYFWFINIFFRKMFKNDILIRGICSVVLSLGFYIVTVNIIPILYPYSWSVVFFSLISFNMFIISVISLSVIIFIEHKNKKKNDLLNIDDINDL